MVSREIGIAATLRITVLQRCTSSYRYCQWFCTPPLADEKELPLDTSAQGLTPSAMSEHMSNVKSSPKHQSAFIAAYIPMAACRACSSVCQNVSPDI